MENSVEDKALATMGIEIEDKGEWQKVMFGTPENSDFDILAVMEGRATAHGDAEWGPGYWSLCGSRKRAIRHIAGVARNCFGKSLSEIALSER